MKRDLYRFITFALCLLAASFITPTGVIAADNTRVQDLNLKAIKLMINDLNKTYGSKYPNGKKYLATINQLDPQISDIANGVANGDKSAIEKADELVSTCRKAQLENPLLDFEKILLVRRSAQSPLGLPQNWQDNSSLPKRGYDTEIALLSGYKTNPQLSTFFKPENNAFVGDVRLNYDAQKLLFSMPDEGNCWQLWEINAAGKDLRQITPGKDRDVHNFDATYLPDGRIIFCSTACFEGIPCVGGGDLVSLLYMLDKNGKIRQLTFDQDHSWMPTVTNDGKVIYTRWEYGDLPHYFSRLLFRMNPDGTEQKALYGSNSYWPNSLFYSKPIPNDPTKFVGIVSGHHGVPRMGDMVVFDAGKGDQESEGAMQRIGHYGEPVQPLIGDGIVDNNWPKFLHPYPLSEKYFIASVKPDPNAAWGVYLVDTFNNMLKLSDSPNNNLFEPTPVRKTTKPPVIPDRVDLKKKDATVYLYDVYSGEGMKNVPRGAVKNLRVYSFHYAYPRMGGHINIGIDGSWDVHRILGTVPVNKDGSTSFKVPANTPIAVQPLDSEGKALQLMRSWFTAMPGEKISCVGCHERQKTTPPTGRKAAMTTAPYEIKPWYGPARGFSFPREVQPVLNKYCVSCHDGATSKPDLRYSGKVGGFSSSYRAIHPYINRPGPESDYHVLNAGEYCADTSELVQILKKGHHGVKLDKESWDRIYTWIDLNVPDHGTWGEHTPIQADFKARRAQLRNEYANLDEDPEAILTAANLGEPIKPEPIVEKYTQVPALPGWPLDESQAKSLQSQSDSAVTTTILYKSTDGKDISIEMVLIPKGQFIMGGNSNAPLKTVKIDSAFWMSKYEITNEQFTAFDPKHESRYFNRMGKDQSDRGISMEGAKQPVVRVSYKEAADFCSALGKQTSQKIALPTEAQWEYACRAGTDTAFYFGSGKDFGQYANLADETLSRLAGGGAPAWRPSDTSSNDGNIATTNAGSYKPNAWGLYDMTGNAAEWTSSAISESINGPLQIVKGGSFYDRPYRAQSSFSLAYPAWRTVFNVGFRIICPAETKKY